MITIDIREAKRITDSYSAFLSFDYNAKIVNILRELPVRFYDKNHRTWEVPVSSVNELIDKLQDFNIKLIGKVTELEPKQVVEGLPKGFEFKTQPYSHQIEGVEYGLKYDKWFLGDEQGLGKSKQAIDIAIARKIAYNYKHCLIVCGVNTLKWNWVKEVHIHSDEGAYIPGQRTKRNGRVYIGSTKDKVADAKSLDSIEDYFIITNIESFRSKDFADAIKKACLDGEIDMCVADEIHKMKNPSSQQSKGFLKCLPKCRIAMTGTPLMNNPLDLYIILKWLGYEAHSFYSFKNHYCVMGGFNGYDVIGYQNMDQLTEQFRNIMLRRLKANVLDLPEKIYVDDIVDMTDKQALIYNEVKNDIKAHIDQVTLDAVNPLSALIRLRQATGYTGILSSEIKESAKLDRMEDIVEEAVANNDKCIIFSNWTQMTEAIIDRLGAYNPALITGNTKDNDRTEQQDKFMNDDTCKVIVGTIGAMGTGLTLTAGSTVIFLDEPWNKALFDQAVDRAHRIGTKNNVTIYSIMCRDTIDERIHDLIYKKGQMSDAIVDGKIVGDKTAIINYLMQ